MANQDFRLGDCVVRTQRCCIERDGRSRRVKPKSMEVLERLAAAGDRVVSRNELFDAVWPGQAVSDDVLTHSIVELRKALGDSARDSQIIETIPKKGFRLVAGVLPVGGVPSPRRPRSIVYSTFAAALIAGAVIMAAWRFSAESVTVSSLPDTTPKSVAVLPFVDLSPGQDQGYFADGLSEELINRLTQIDGLQVTGRTSSFYFKGRNEDLRDVGHQLAVSYVLEGSVRKSDDELRITAQLIDVGNGFHLWSDTYDRSYEDIFAIQEEIAEAVATALSIRLSVGQLGTVAGGTSNVDAFDEVMLGSAAYREFTAESMMRAIGHLERATRLDPDFAIAWARLANVYRTAWLTVGNDDIDYWNGLTDHAIARARAGAPQSEYVLRTAAYIAVDRQNWGAARRLFDTVAALDPPGKPEQSGAYMDLLAKTGNIREALRMKERYSLADPLHPDVSMYLGHLYLSGGHVDDALAEFERGYGLGGYRSQISVEGVVAALASGDAERVRTWLGRAVEHQQPGAKGVHEVMLRLLDDREQALAWLHAGFESRSVADYYVIVWASYYRDDDLALRAMRRSPDLWAFWTPLTRHLRITPEFRGIVQTIGLVDYWRRYGWNDFCHPVDESDFVCS